MSVAHQSHMWFKCKLLNLGGTYSPLEPPIYTQQKYRRMDRNGHLLDNTIHTRRIPLNFKVESIFQGEFLCVPNETILEFDVEQCFSYCLFPNIKFGLDSDSERFLDYTCGEEPCICNYYNG